MSYYDNSEQDGSKQRWIQDTHEARRNAMEIRRQIPPQIVQTRPFDVPELVDYYNRLLMEYVSQLRPKRDSLGKHWDKEILSVSVPKSGQTVDLGVSDHRGEVDVGSAIQEAELVDREVNLDTLSEKWVRDGFITVHIKYINSWDGPVEQTISKNLYLPVYAGDAVLEQCNDCLEFLGWLPKQEITEYQATDDEVLTHQ